MEENKREEEKMAAFAGLIGGVGNAAMEYGRQVRQIIHRNRQANRPRRPGK